MTDKPEKKSVHEYLTVNDLENFNDKVQRIVHRRPSKSQLKKAETPIEEAPTGQYDSNKYESVTVNPSEITDDLLYQLADIIDKKKHFNSDDFKDTKIVGPSTQDRILGSIAVVYITEQNIPVAVAVLEDPTVINYKGIIPGDLYELKSGQSLENRIQLLFFEVLPEKMGHGLDKELKRGISELSPKTFYINPFPGYKPAQQQLENIGYALSSTFNTEWDDEPLELWLN